MKKAYFVKHPRVIDNLLASHLPQTEQFYEICHTLTLAPIDYENFIYDMTVARQYIEDNAHFCQMGDVIKCLLIKARWAKNGVLVVPDIEGYVGCAAYVAHIE